jgi:putative heme-binding domain-containing protein
VTRTLERLLPQIKVDDRERESQVAQLDTDARSGNAERGRLIFSGNRAACSVCHRAAGSGGSVGPELTRIGKVRTPRDLAESILFPSATIANGFESFTVTTKPGQVLTGLIRRESADAIHLVATDGTEARVPRSQIEEIAPSPISVMPQSLDRQLSRRELADLVAFLSSLGN